MISFRIFYGTSVKPYKNYIFLQVNYCGKFSECHLHLTSLSLLDFKDV